MTEQQARRLADRIAGRCQGVRSVRCPRAERRRQGMVRMRKRYAEHARASGGAATGGTESRRVGRHSEGGLTGREVPMPRPMEQVLREIHDLAALVEQETDHAALLRLLGKLDQLEAEWLEIGVALGLVDR